MGSLPHVKNRRSEPRVHGLKQSITFALAGKDLREPIPIKAVDVSRRGLGFLVGQRLQTNVEYVLIIGGKRFRVETSYCDSELGLEDRFRVGIYVRDAEVNLIETCIALGVLDPLDAQED